MPTNKEIFESSMDALANSINTKAGTTGKKTITQLKAAVDSITPGITPTGNINITTTAQTDVTNYATATVVDADLIAGNIKKDVNILGVTGTYEGGGITPTGNINITTTSQVDVTNYATAQVVDSDLIAANIKKNINILGVTGTYDPEETIYGEIITDTYGTTGHESTFVVNASEETSGMNHGDIYLKVDAAPNSSTDRDLRITLDSSYNIKAYTWDGMTEELSTLPISYSGASSVYIWGNGIYSVNSGTGVTVNTTYDNAIEITGTGSTVNLNITLYHGGGAN